MSFFSILLALLLEQVRPLGGDHPVRRATRAWALWMARTFDAGERRQAWVTWTLLWVFRLWA